MKNENRLILLIIPMANWPCEFDEKSKKIFHCSLQLFIVHCSLQLKNGWEEVLESVALFLLKTGTCYAKKLVGDFHRCYIFLC